MKIATDIRKIAPDTVSASLPSYSAFPGVTAAKEGAPQQFKPQQAAPKKPVLSKE